MKNSINLLTPALCRRQQATTLLSIILTLLLFPAITQCQKASTSGYKISGTLTNAVNRKLYLTMNDAMLQGVRRDSTLTDKSGRFVFKGKVDEPVLYSIKLADSLHKSGSVFFLNNADITISGNADSLEKARIVGAIEEDIRQEYDNDIFINKAIETEVRAIRKARAKATKENDSVAIKAVELQRKAFENKMVALITEKIKKHPTAASSVDMISVLIKYDTRLADSLLTQFESSAIKHYTRVKLTRNRVNVKKSLMIGNPAPVFTQQDVSGKQFNLHSLKGKYVLLDFWASWCGPCRKDNPNLVRLYEKYKSRNFEIVSVSLDQKRDAWEKAIEDDKLSWIHTSDLKVWQNTVAVQYQVDSVPTNFLLDPEGNILAVNLNGTALEEKLNTIFVSN